MGQVGMIGTAVGQRASIVEVEGKVRPVAQSELADWHALKPEAILDIDFCNKFEWHEPTRRGTLRTTNSFI